MRSISPEKLVQAVEQHPDAVAVCLTYCETSTAVLNPVPELVSAVRSTKKEILTIVDAISALGTLPLSQKDSDIDAVIAGSQKAFMLPAGLSMLSFSDRAWEAIESNSAGSLYYDLKIERGKTV